jgi:hypothetical protein
MKRAAYRKIAVAILLVLVAAAAAWSQRQEQPTARKVSPNNGFLYQPSKGSIWDPTVIYANNQYYMFSMYGGDSVWLATSADGVHWKDYGVVVKSEGFKNNRVWKQFINKVGDRYIMDYGAFTDQGSSNNLLRFWESKDLTHWTYVTEVPVDTNYYRDKGGRWDHMFMVPKDEANPSAGYVGYVVAKPLDSHSMFGFMESPDGVHFTPRKPPEVIADFGLPGEFEIGGIRKFGSKYYLIGGVGNPPHFGFTGYSVLTYTSDSLMGPFRPDMDAYRLTGTSGSDTGRQVHILSSFVKDSPEDLISDPFTFRASGTDGHGTWFEPMRKAVIDSKGHLRLGYWKQNDLAKGKEIPADAAKNIVVFPPGQRESDPIVKVAGTQDSLLVYPDKPWTGFPWLDSTGSRTAVVLLDQRFDLDQGIIMEGHIKATAARRSFAGFYMEGLEKNTGTAIMLQVGEPQWRTSEIGKVKMDLGFHFESLDVTGRYAATVNGLDPDVDHTFRLWLRGGQMELYIDDLLMQSYLLFSPSGRIGFISQDGEVQFSQLKFYAMNL